MSCAPSAAGAACAVFIAEAWPVIEPATPVRPQLAHGCDLPSTLRRRAAARSEGFDQHPAPPHEEPLRSRSSGRPGSGSPTLSAASSTPATPIASPATHSVICRRLIRSRGSAPAPPVRDHGAAGLARANRLPGPGRADLRAPRPGRFAGIRTESGALTTPAPAFASRPRSGARSPARAAM